MSEQFWREFGGFWTMTTIKSSYKSSHDCSERKQWACAPFYNYDDTQSHRFLHLQKEHQFLFFILRHQIPYFWYYQQVLKKSSWYISDYSALSALVSVLISGLWQQSYVKWLLKCDLDWGILSNTILVQTADVCLSDTLYMLCSKIIGSCIKCAYIELLIHLGSLSSTQEAKVALVCTSITRYTIANQFLNVS